MRRRRDIKRELSRELKLIVLGLVFAGAATLVTYLGLMAFARSAGS